MLLEPQQLQMFTPFLSIYRELNKTYLSLTVLDLFPRTDGRR